MSPHRAIALSQGCEPTRMPRLCEATGSIPRAGAIRLSVREPLATHRREITCLTARAVKERTRATSVRLVDNAQFMVKLTKRVQTGDYT
jgi:hypothetical protein